MRNTSQEVEVRQGARGAGLVVNGPGWILALPGNQLRDCGQVALMSPCVNVLLYEPKAITEQD